MKQYTKVTQHTDGKLFGWYPVLDESGDMHQDYDVIEDYALEVMGTTYLAKHTPTSYVFVSYSTLDEALEGIKNNINSKIEMNYKADQRIEQGQRLIQKTSLDERYKDVEPKKVVLTNDQLKKKYSRVQKEKIRAKGMNRWSASIQKKQGGYDTYK